VHIDFATLFALSPNPYVVLDANYVIVWMNDAYLRATMRRREELSGRHMFEAFPSDPGSEGGRLLRGSLDRVAQTREADEIALIRYDIARPDGTMEVRYWSATHTPLLDDAGQIELILQHTVDVTELHGLRQEMGLIRRARAVQERNLDLVEESQQLKDLFDQAPGFVAMLSGPDHVFRMANRAYLALVGDRNVVGQPVAQALPEVVDQGFIALLDKVIASGQPFVGQNVSVLLSGSADAEPARRFLNFIYQPIRAEDGTVSGVLVQGHDVTEEVAAEQRQKLLIDELNHRVKNTLAIVQSLASQSFRQVEGAEDARGTFDARLHALAAAHSLLTARNWEDAQLLDIVRSSVEATAGSDAARFRMSGPDFALRPQTAVSLAMILHELGTNAIKYGALSTAGGEIDVGWSIEDTGTDCRLTIDWVERGGPPATAPARPGFGTRLIHHGLSAEKGARVTLDFLPEGLHCRLMALLPHTKS